MISAVFIFFLFGVSASLAANEKIIVCYYGTWATYRWGDGKFDVENINPNLCTHLVYTFVGIDAEGTVISLDPYLDLPDNWNRDNFRKFTSLKEQNPKLKTLLAVGGYNEGSAKYSSMVANPTSRQNFISSALKMVQDHSFDGLDVDWEYPNRRDTVYGTADIDNFTQLLKELREEFDKYGLLLTAAVSSVEAMASLSYDIPAISKYLDYINVMTYDMYGSWDPVTGHNAPLHKGEGDDEQDASSLYTVDVALDFWLRAGCPPEKLIVGVPFYGRTFTLSDASVNTVRAPSSGPGIAGQYTGTNGLIGYNEFCVKLQTESWTIRNDEKAKVPYAIQNLNWVSYDDPTSIASKVDYALNLDVGGIMIWSIETDDFRNLCGGGDFPLLRTINKALYGNSSDITSTTSSSSENPISSTASPISTTVEPTTGVPPTTGPSISTTESSVSSTELPISSSSTSTSSSTTSDSICLVEGLTANPNDCSSFFMCVQQPNEQLLAFKFLCPTSLLWDRDNLNCNYAQYVDCT